MLAPREGPAETPDRGALGLELGLAAVVALAPLPFGAVGPTGRLALELASLGLLAGWVLHARRHATTLPPLAVRVGVVGLLSLAALQALPLGAAAVGALSPGARDVREASRPPQETLAAEAQLVALDPTRLEPAATLSVDPLATASALRTGAALAALLFVATGVAAHRPMRLLALALLLSAGFQGLYGTLTVASGHDRIWHVPKVHFLDAATGTFVNRNHFACALAAALACGTALLLSDSRRRNGGSRRRLGDEGLRRLLLGIPLVAGLAGLFLSFSRAGIVVGLLGLTWTVLAAGGGGRVRVRLTVALVVLGVALVPLAQLGIDPWIERFGELSRDVGGSGGRLDVWRDTLRLVAMFPVFGCGFGAFGSAYPLVRSPHVRSFYAHAHNDPLQALAEAGLIGVPLLLLLVVPLLRGTLGGLVGHKGLLGAGFAAGLSAILLHGLIDFDLHIPSSAATAAVLAGVVLGLPRSAPR